MKYWTGCLTAAIIGAITWALTRLGAKFTTLVDMVYPYVTRTLQDMLARWSSGVDFCLWQMLALAAVVILIASIVLMIILRWNPIRWFGWVLAACSMVFLLHTMVYGLNYYAGPLAEDIRLEVADSYTLDELTAAAAYYRDQANGLAEQMERDANGDPKFDSFAALAEQAENGFHNLVYRDTCPVFAGSTLPVKELGWADLYSSMGITGVTMGLTGEAAVNPQTPAVCLPFTMCHEMAHRMCIATEGDANFAAFLAGQANDSLQFRYSAYFMAYRYCYSALRSVNTEEAAGAAARIASGVGAKMQHDLDQYNAFFAKKRNDTATRVADAANDTYLKASGDKAGVASYGQVADLLVAWHIQQVVLPAITEQQVPFDPYDESQVDLSGIANAREPQPTEAPADGGVG